MPDPIKETAPPLEISHYALLSPGRPGMSSSSVNSTTTTDGRRSCSDNPECSHESRTFLPPFFTLRTGQVIVNPSVSAQEIQKGCGLLGSVNNKSVDLRFTFARVLTGWDLDLYPVIIGPVPKRVRDIRLLTRGRCVKHTPRVH